MKKFDLKKHSALIFTSISVVGVIGTAILGVRAGMKAEHIMRELKDVPEDPKEKIKLYIKETWQCYVLVSLTALLSAGAAIASHKISAKDIARLATLATGSGAAFSKYRGKIKEILGEEKEKEIFEQVKAESDWGAWPPIVDMDSEEYNRMDTKFRLDLDTEGLEPVEFYSSSLRVANALWNFERNFVLGWHTTVAELKDFLGIPHTEEDFKYFWIEDAFYLCDIPNAFIDLFVDYENPIISESGEKILPIRPRGGNSYPITDEIYKAIEDGSYWDEWRNKCEDEKK